MERWRRWRGAIFGTERRELGLLLALAAMAGGGWVFVEVADEVVEGDTGSFDRAVVLALREPGNPADPIGPRWVEEMERDFTALGGVALLTLLTLAVVSFLLLRSKPRGAAFVAVSVLGALVLSRLLKQVFDRPRPDLVPQLSYVTSSSFPSGHSMLSAAVYLTLGALLARLQKNIWLKAHALGWAVLFTLLAGSSRVYLGVHWPQRAASDGPGVPLAGASSLGAYSVR
jgi:undecaprenyl-diphosphatase